MRAYHYTWGDNFFSIVDQGVILRSGDKDDQHADLSRRGLYAGTPERERVAWFSLSESYDRTAVPGIIERGSRRPLTFDELLAHGGVFRIAIDAEHVPDGFDAWARKSKSPKAIVAALRKTAINAGAPVHLWRVSWSRVPSSLWLGADQFVDGTWKPIALASWKAAT